MRFEETSRAQLPHSPANCDAWTMLTIKLTQRRDIPANGATCRPLPRVRGTYDRPNPVHCIFGGQRKGNHGRHCMNASNWRKETLSSRWE